MDFFNPNWFIHVGNILLLIAYSVRDILWLRLFAVGAAVITIPFFLLQPIPLWAPLAWTVVFASINMVQSFRLILERRPVRLSFEEEEVRRLALASLSPRKVLEVLGIGQWTDAEAGERFIEANKPLSSVWLIIRGRVRITAGDRVLGELVPGQVVGSALLLTGVPATVDACVVERVRAVRWEIATMQRYLNANPEVRMAIQQHLSRDLAGKLERTLGAHSDF